MQFSFEPKAILRAAISPVTKLQRAMGTEGAALLVAVVIGSLIYVSLTALYRNARSNQIHQSLQALAGKDPALLSSVTNRVSRLGFYLGTGGAPKRNLYGLISAGDVEADARKLKRLLTERMDSFAENGADPASLASANTGPTADLKQFLDEQLVNGLLASTIRSKFFGPFQFVCYILTLWVSLFIVERWRAVSVERRFLEGSVLRLGGERLLTPDEADEGLILPQVSKSLVGQVLRRAVERFAASRDAAAAEAVVRTECEAIAQEHDTSLAMVRYVIWAVPAIGFIGTTGGMGSAMSKADSPENLPDVVGFLGGAFDTTLVALLLCLVLMLLSHQFQRYYEEFVLRLGNKCERDFIRRLYVPRIAENSAPADSKFGA